MKHFYFLFLLISSLGVAQPVGYYNKAIGLLGEDLKNSLHTIIDNIDDSNGQPFHDTSVTYTSLWTLYQTSDVRDDGKVWDMYSGCDFTFITQQDNGTSVSGECEKYNREHTFPKSWFGDINNHPMQADAFHIIPTDKSVNAFRANFAYGEVAIASNTSSNNSKLGSSNLSGPTDKVFEPINIYKGDIARGLFYVAVRYQDEISGWETENPNGDSMLDGSSFKVFEQWALDMLYQWHIDDEVSEKERERNEEIYKHQNNRNPFIDHPEYVASIWSSVLSTNDENFNNDVSIFPNPLKENLLNIKTRIDLQVEIYDVLGKRIVVHKVDINNKTINLSKLRKGIYLLKLKSESGSVTKKLIKQ